MFDFLLDLQVKFFVNRGHYYVLGLVLLLFICSVLFNI